jgi:hypothetical protein
MSTDSITNQSSATVEEIFGWRKPPGSAPLTVAEYAKAKNLPEGYLRNTWGLRESDGGIIIPYRNAEGTLFRNKRRRTLSHEDSNGELFTKWLGERPTDLKTIPYGLDHIKPDHTILLLDEGESDTQTAWFHGIPALGISGADGWHDEFAKLPAVANATTIYIMKEPGEGGEKFVAKLARAPLREKSKVVTLPVKDLSELHLQSSDRAAFMAALKKAIDAAQPMPAVSVEARPEIVADATNASRNAATFEGYLRAAGIKAKCEPYERGDFRYRWILPCCLFNSAHTGTSVAVFMIADGTLKFKCQHDTCKSNKWPQFEDYLAKTIGKPIAFEESRQEPPRSTKQPKKSAENGTDNSSTRTLTFTRGDQVKMRKVSWLWKGRLVAEGLNSFSGEPGVGKSTVAADSIAAITRGKNFSDGALNELGPKDVWIICDEEGREDTIVPRLTLAGADLTRVWFLDIDIHQGQTVEQAGTRLDEDLPLIEEKLREHPDMVLIVPDPVTEYFGNANPNSDQEVGPIYTKMLQASKRHHVAWLLISHFNKDCQATSTNRNSGAKVMVTKARCNWRFAADPNSTDGRCLMLQGKCNLAKRKALAYYIETQSVATEDVGVSLVLENITRIRWDGETGDQADDVLLSKSDPKERADTKVKAFLLSIVEDIWIRERCVVSRGDSSVTTDSRWTWGQQVCKGRLLLQRENPRVVEEWWQPQFETGHRFQPMPLPNHTREIETLLEKPPEPEKPGPGGSWGEPYGFAKYGGFGSNSH